MTYHQRREQAAAEATAFLRENDDRTSAERAAIDAIDQRMWILWHANNRDLGVILVLSRAGLLRDPADEARRAQADLVMGRAAAREHRADRIAAGRYCALIEEAADRLEAGEDPALIATRMRAARNEIDRRREKDRRDEEQP
ncbi:hypothetical protein F0L17_14630 [Streptomyces sp. TRM43335]|uniref:Uncharacterized protein n=1 Tax=Streptomyces taklimakanensis TaxID=2569853 RepID=A0A6G2BDG1_9ACTN|nr:hypothetical protein [Streptomyces taklimakanensis]MTE20321.1 hypothetical protein [Streptomyces taklimakanensis]